MFTNDHGYQTLIQTITATVNTQSPLCRQPLMRRRMVPVPVPVQRRHLQTPPVTVVLVPGRVHRCMTMSPSIVTTNGSKSNEQSPNQIPNSTHDTLLPRPDLEAPVPPQQQVLVPQQVLVLDCHYLLQWHRDHRRRHLLRGLKAILKWMERSTLNR